MTTGQRGYGRAHQATRKGWAPYVAAGQVRCWRCGDWIRPGEAWDLGHDDGNRFAHRGPEHVRCNRATSGRRWTPPPVAGPEPEPVGLAAADERWNVAWLKGLRRVPRDAVWPRYMTAPHPLAVGSLGPAFIRWAERREGRKLRWWQRLVATRLLEVDAHGVLVWEVLILSMARQLGKSWLLRELLLWRIHQGDVFGEPQDVLHTGKDLQVCKEVLRPALFWADDRPGVYKTGRANGEQYLELLADHSRWMLRAKTSTYGYAVSVAAVDEAWKVKPEIVDEGIAPTMVERKQPQLLLVSTAHRQATALMLARRKAALASLETGDGDLLIEWSTPRVCDLVDVAGWRQASPHWTKQRERLIGRQLEQVAAGEAEQVEDEADPVEAFKAQWLNVWPDRGIAKGDAVALLQPGLWEWLEQPVPDHDHPLYVMVEERNGERAAVAVAAQLDDDRVEVDGWMFDDWDSAIGCVQDLAASRPVKMIGVGASLLAKAPPNLWPPPRPVGARETRVGLPLLRDLAASGGIVHVDTPDLDGAMQAASVKERASGLALEPVNETTPLVKALVWAVHAAAVPARVPAVY